MKQVLVILIITLFCFAFTTDVQKRVIRDKEYDIECFVTSKALKNYNNKKMYYWFRSGKVHRSVSSSGGFLLHGNYSKFFKDNRLAEQGEFSQGLKHGAWKTWYKNGQLKTKEYWDNGFKEWGFTSFDSLGNPVLKGHYRNNKRAGKWIDFANKDTLYYKDNTPYKEKPLNLIERTVRKRDSLEKIQIKQERITKRYNDSLKRVKLKKERIIKKRNDSIHKAQEKISKQRQKKIDSINKSKQPKKNFFKHLFEKK